MRRRNFFKTLAVTPAAAMFEPSLAAQQAAPGQAAGDAPLAVTYTEQVGEPLPRFFSAEQFVALRRLCDLIMPAIGTSPGAIAAKVPEFLDFLIADAPADRQGVYRDGLDLLNSESRKQHNRPFDQLDAAQADALLAPLRAPWTFEPPADAVARFLRAAKADVRTATVNSREYLNPGGGSGGRRFSGSGLYWNEI